LLLLLLLLLLEEEELFGCLVVWIEEKILSGEAQINMQME